MTVKNWFLTKNFNANERIAISETEPTVERETEKAMLLKWNTEYGIITSWIPKSCIVDTPAVKKVYEDLTGRTVTTKDGKSLTVVADNGAALTLSNNKTYARFTLSY